MLDMLDSHVHLKYYNNLHGQSTTINVDLEGVKRICQALQRDHGEDVP